MKRKILLLTLAVVMVLTSLSIGVYGAKTTDPLPQDTGALKWSQKLSGLTPPTLYNNHLYVAANKKVHKIDKETGKIIKSSATLAGSMGYTTLSLTCENGKIFVPLSKGKIEILDADTLSQIRVTEESDTGQNISPISYIKTGDKEYIYTGTWSSQKDGTFYCIDVETGQIIWKEIKKNGFYWAGAYVNENYAVFGSEGGTLFSHSSIDNQRKDTRQLDGDIRSSVVKDGNYVYLTTKAGTLYKVAINEDGTFGEEIASCKLGGESTSTPIISSKGTIYVAIKNKGIGVIDKETMKIKYIVQTPGYIQGELLINDSKTPVDIYGVYSNGIGGICQVKDYGTSAKSVNLFIPSKTMQQYSISNIVNDKQGTLYFMNDSGYLMAVAQGYKINSSTTSGGIITASQSVMIGRSVTFRASPKAEYYIDKLEVDKVNKGRKYSYIFSKVNSNHTIKATFKKLYKPVGVKATAGKKKINIKWSKNSQATAYQIYRADKKTGKYKLIKTTSKTSYSNVKLKKGKSYFYKVRAYKTVDGKKTYSSYSTIVSKKAK